MAFDWNGVVAPGFGLAGTTVGLALGSWLQRRAAKEQRAADVEIEQRRWQRDRRLDAYAAFIGPVQQYMFQASILDRTDYTPETVAPVRVQLAKILDEMGQAVGAMTFVAPKPITQIAMEVETLCLECYDLVVGSTWIRATPEGLAHWEALGQWVGGWTAAAHADLSGHPIEIVPPGLPATSRWEQGKGWLDDRLNG